MNAVYQRAIQKLGSFILPTSPLTRKCASGEQCLYPGIRVNGLYCSRACKTHFYKGVRISQKNRLTEARLEQWNLDREAKIESRRQIHEARIEQRNQRQQERQERHALVCDAGCGRLGYLRRGFNRFLCQAHYARLTKFGSTGSAIIHSGRVVEEIRIEQKNLQHKAVVERREQRYDAVRKPIIALWLAGESYDEIGTLMGFSRQRAQQLIKPSPAVLEQLRMRAGNRCEHCGIAEPTGRKHHGHHKALVSPHNDLSNLEYLCQPCHRAVDHEVLSIQAVTWVSQGETLLISAQNAVLKDFA